MSPALAGGFFTTEPPGKPPSIVFYMATLCNILFYFCILFTVVSREDITNE